MNMKAVDWTFTDPCDTGSKFSFSRGDRNGALEIAIGLDTNARIKEDRRKVRPQKRPILGFLTFCFFPKFYQFLASE